MALVFAPEAPLEEWFRELDEWSKKSPGYFVGRPIILDVTALPLDKEELAKLLADLNERDIRIMGVEGTKVVLPRSRDAAAGERRQPHDFNDRASGDFHLPQPRRRLPPRRANRRWQKGDSRRHARTRAVAGACGFARARQAGPLRASRSYSRRAT